MCNISDYESSLGVYGTGFWRAPKVLVAQKNQAIESHMFTEMSHVYSFGMTFYEVSTGCVPFEGVGKSDYDHVPGGGRPRLPETVKPALKMLLSRFGINLLSKDQIFTSIFNYFELSASIPIRNTKCNWLKYAVDRISTAF